MNTYIWKTKEPIDTKNNKRMIGLYAGRTKHTAAHRTRGCAFSGNQWCRPIGGDEVDVIYEETISSNYRSPYGTYPRGWFKPINLTGLYEELLIQTLYRYVRNLQAHPTDVSVEVLNANRGTKFGKCAWKDFTNKVNEGRDWNAHSLGVIKRKIK